VDQGVDTGAIIFQRYVIFSEQENTYAKTYKKLRVEIELLFKEHFEDIILNNFKAVRQPTRGTKHLSADLPREFSGWDSDISKEVARLKKIANNN
jgi:methionyl-tRNA formyltransferase